MGGGGVTGCAVKTGASLDARRPHEEGVGGGGASQMPVGRKLRVAALPGAARVACSAPWPGLNQRQKPFKSCCFI